MMKNTDNSNLPDHTAVRVALWRGLHVLLDSAPHVFKDELGVKLVNDPAWRQRPDMDPQFSKSMRASIVGRARFIEDLVEELLNKGINQYVILGAGLDTFAQRRTDLSKQLKIFEVDQPGPQEWKKQRLAQLGYKPLPNLHYVPVDFEKSQLSNKQDQALWWEALLQSGFQPDKPSLFVSTGVSMYLSKQTNFSLLQQLSKLATGSVFAMTFMLSTDLLKDQEKESMLYVMKKAQESGTPFLSLFTPDEILKLSKEAGFKQSRCVSAEDLYQRYFAQRPDGLNAGTAECFLLAHTDG